MKLLKAKYIHYPELYKEYSLSQLENFMDYRRLELSHRRTESQRYRLQCLMKELDENGLHYPILVSWVGYRVTVGHQRVWYATQRGYSHISCYHLRDQTDFERVMESDFSEEYWKKFLEKNV